MSLLIEHMDMPKNCDDCRLRSFNLLGGMMCCLVDENVTNQEFAYKRLPNCPLSEIPTPHGDLIDREVLLNEYKADPKEEKAMMNENLAAYLMMDEIVEKVVENIKSIPTIIEAEG